VTVPSSPLRFLALLSGLLAALLLLSSCGRRETLVEKGIREQILHRAIGHELGDLDPHLATQTIDYHVLSALFEGLVSEDPVDLHPVPGVAESWDVSDDGLVFTFHLREKARWSNGDPLTSADFIASFRRALSPSLGSENASQLHIVKGAAAYHRGEHSDFSKVGFEAPDARTLRIQLAHPAPYFLSMLNQSIWFPVHTGIISKLGPVDKRGTPWTRKKHFVSNGPFRLKEWSINHRIVVERDPAYWDAAKIKLREIHFYPNGVDSQERAFRAGQLHVTDAVMPSKVEYYRQHSPKLLRLDPWLGTYFLRLNTQDSLLADPRLRRALSLAVDRNAIVQRVLRGAPVEAHSFTPQGMPGYDAPALARSDFEEARAWLAAAGFPAGHGMPTLELTLNSSDLHRQVAEAIQEMWRRELGVDLKLVIMENRSVLSARRSGDYQLLVSTWTGDYADPRNFLEIWKSDSGNNFTGWKDDAFDALLNDSDQSSDPDKRMINLLAAENILLESSPCIPVYHLTHAYLIHPSVRGWHANLLGHHPYKGVWLAKE